MSATKHLALQKFEPVDMPFRGAITPRQGEGCVNSGIVSTNPVDKAAQFGHVTGFGLLEPGVQCFRLAFFGSSHGMRNEMSASIQCRAKQPHKQSRSHRLLASKQECNKGWLL